MSRLEKILLCLWHSCCIWDNNVAQLVVLFLHQLFRTPSATYLMYVLAFPSGKTYGCFFLKTWPTLLQGRISRLPPHCHTRNEISDRNTNTECVNSEPKKSHIWLNFLHFDSFIFICSMSKRYFCPSIHPRYSSTLGVRKHQKYPAPVKDSVSFLFYSVDAADALITGSVCHFWPLLKCSIHTRLLCFQLSCKQTPGLISFSSKNTTTSLTWNDDFCLFPSGFRKFESPQLMKCFTTVCQGLNICVSF